MAAGPEPQPVATKLDHRTTGATRHNLASALLATGASRPQIQAICKWQTEESLNNYARLNEIIYSSLPGKALTASATSIRTTSITGIILEGEVLR